MATEPKTYRFDDIVVDLESGELRKGGKVVPLEPKGFELLVYFLQNRGRLIEKQAILDAVWADAFVTENALTRAVAQVRKALGDDAHEPRYLQTVPKRGYRFVPDVDERSSGERASARGDRERRLVTVSLALALAAASAGALWLVARPVEPDLPAEMPLLRPMQLTASAGLALFPSFSPDGSAFAYSSDRSGSFEIHVQQVPPGVADLQITANGMQNLQPAWSPRGDFIAYYSWAGQGGIWLVSALGGPPRRLTDFGSSPAWSPDGELIVFQSGPLRDLGSSTFSGPPPSTLWTVSVQGTLRQLTKPGEPRGGHGFPKWSPDGKEVAFVTTGSVSNIWRLWPDEGRQEILLEGGPRYYDLAYSSAGDALYFTADDDMRHGLWRVDLASDEAQRKPSLIFSREAPVLRYPSISPDGTRVLYAAVTTRSNLASLRVSPKTHEPIGSPELLTRYTNDRNYMPRFSPDGSTIAFERFTSGRESDIWLIDRDGSNDRALTTDSGYEHRPLWSIDGKRIFYFTLDEEWRAAMWSIQTADRRETFVRPIPPLMAQWEISPDGRTVAFASSRAGNVVNVWIAPMDDLEDPTQLTFDKEMMGFPLWSPDGTRLALQVQRGSDTQVGVVSLRDGEVQLLTSEPGTRWGGSWSPDGEKYAYTALRDDRWNLCWVSLADPQERKLTDYSLSRSYVRYPAWSPQGDQIVFEYADTTGEIWLLELPP
jgi:Tol biopolymer transport system component/DNA-binding winged helix-turn-helix (wHTH) protein